MVSRTKVLLVTILAIAFGAFFCGEAFQILRVINAPIVTGDVLSTAPVKIWGMPRTDITIQIQGSTTQVHAITGGYLLPTLPKSVRFHYSGDPSREVFLFEHEESPFWIILLCWGSAAFFLLLLSRWPRLDGMRRALGWLPRASPT